MKLLVYCKDYYPLETGFSIAFRGFCEALVANNKDVEIDVVTPVNLMDAQELSSDRLRIIRLDHIVTENYDNYFSGADARRSHWRRLTGKFLMIFAILNNRVAWSRRITELYRLNHYDMVLFESGDDPLVMGILSKEIIRKAGIRFHSTGDTESARYRNSLFSRFTRCVIRTRVAPNIRVILATNQYHLNFIKDFYYAHNPFECARRYFGVIDNVVANFGGPSGRMSKQDNVRRLVTLGRMDPAGVAQKGFEDILYALATLDTAHNARLHVEIIGDGERRNYLETLKTKLGLSNVKFCGRISNSEVRRKLQEADVIVLLSRFEGRSVFAIEGMLAGCAVLFTSTGGLADLVQQNGWSVNVQDITQISTTLAEIANTSPQALVEMGMRSRQIALNRFNEEQVGTTGYRHLKNACEFLK